MRCETAHLHRLESALRLALPAWGLPPAADLTLVAVSENATWCARDPAAGRKLILRVHRPGYHTAAEILSELAWITALRAERIVDTPAPVPAIDGRPLIRIDAGGQPRLVTAFTHMTGRAPDPADDLVPWFRRLGAVTARLHAHSRSWPKPATFARKSWTSETILGPAPHWGDWRAAIGLGAAGKSMLERTEKRLRHALAAYGTAPDRFGLIHADLRLANLLVDGDRLGVIDFDDCGLGWFAFDFAAAVTFHEHEPFVPAVRAAWAEGYRRVAPLAPEDERAIDHFLMLRRLQLTAWIASRADSPVAQQLGAPYTHGTVELAEAYLVRG